jgi:hypothetical protein
MTFELDNGTDLPPVERPDRALFAPPSRAMLCRHAVYSSVKKNRPERVLLRDLAADLRGAFPSSTVYRAARRLVSAGVLARKDVWDAVRNDSKLRALIGLEYVDPFTLSNRKW